MTKQAIYSAMMVALMASASAEAAIITQWNFNSTTPDSNTNTGTTSPAIGSGNATLVGGTTATFASGDASGGSSDPALGDDSGWNTTTYAAQGTGNKTRGAQFLVSTAGFSNIQINYDLRHSNTSSRYEQVQYTTNGSTWTDVALFDGNSGDTWFNNRSVDLSSVAGVANNANFGIRIVAAFAPAGTSYLPSSSTGNYGTAGTWRFDMVTVSGTVVPVPAALPLFLSAVAGVGALRRRAK